MTIPMRNKLPEHGIRIPYEDLLQFVSDLFTRVGMYRHDARLLGELLVRSDMRCVYSHGTRQAPGYLQKIRDGAVNPTPTITVVSESETTVVLDGDGGLGYFPAHQATEIAIAKAKKMGVGIATTRNHFHFGAAGHYSRMAVPHKCIGMAVSAHRYPLDPASTILAASGGSPMSIAFPTSSQPPLVLDMSASMLPQEQALMDQYHWVFMKSLGLGVAIQALGGILAGIWQPELADPGRSKWESNQGSFIAVFNIKNLMQVEEFELGLDHFIRQARKMQPFPGMEKAELPGGMEWHWERESEALGVALDAEHREALQNIADELRVRTPFALFERNHF